MKRRAANVKVVKRATPQSSNANSNNVGNTANGSAGQEDGSGQDKEFMGVVSLVQLERHYGFIEVREQKTMRLVAWTVRLLLQGF